MDGKNHVTGVVADAGIGVTSDVIEELMASFHDRLGSV